METIKPSDLTQFMEDIAAQDAFDVYKLSKRVNELERSKGIELGPAVKWVITGTMILGVIVLVYLVSTGQRARASPGKPLNTGGIISGTPPKREKRRMIVGARTHQFQNSPLKHHKWSPSVQD